jgi:hypothetical protein
LPKVYSLLAPEVESARTKPTNPIAFGCKVTVATTDARSPGGQLVNHINALHRNPSYDGHTLKDAVVPSKVWSGMTLKNAKLSHRQTDRREFAIQVLYSCKSRNNHPRKRALRGALSIRFSQLFHGVWLEEHQSLPQNTGKLMAKKDNFIGIFALFLTSCRGIIYQS